MMQRYGFKYYTAAKEFIKGKSMMEDKCDREVSLKAGDTPLKSFIRVTEIDPTNPYGWAYLLFAMEDAGFSIEHLLLVADKWHETAMVYKHQGQNAFAIMYFTKYMKTMEKMKENGKPVS
jgi:hypothetical protein